MRNSAQPVAVITTLLPRQSGNGTGEAGSSPAKSHVHGATLSSFTTVSLDPPLVAFSVRTPSRLVDALESTEYATKRPHFIVNVLSTKQNVEAAGFSKPGLEPFSIHHDWHERSPIHSSKGNNKDHPLYRGAFFPSKLAKNDQGISVPALSDSLGSLACSIVSKFSLKDLVATEEDVGETTSNKGGSELFLARVHGVEYAEGIDSETSQRLPMVYWDQQFTSVTS